MLIKGAKPTFWWGFRSRFFKLYILYVTVLLSFQQPRIRLHNNDVLKTEKFAYGQQRRQNYSHSHGSAETTKSMVLCMPGQ